MRSTPGTDLVVFEIFGNGTFGWSGRFVQSPRLYASDESTQVSGNCVLQIDLTGFEPAEHDSKDVPQRLTSADATAVVEVLNYSVVEGISQTFIGTRPSTPAVSIDTSVVEDRATVTVSIKER